MQLQIIIWYFHRTATFEDDFTQPCNADCNCTTLVYEPICDTDGISYFSPCHGGCTSEILLEDGITTVKAFTGICRIPNTNLKKFPDLDTDSPNYTFYKGLLLTYGLATRHACYSTATRLLLAGRFFAREPYYRSLMARLFKHKWPKLDIINQVIFQNDEKNKIFWYPSVPSYQLPTKY